MARQTPAQPRLPTPPGWFMRPWVRRRRLTRRGRLRAPSIAANRGAAGTQGYRSGGSLAVARGRLSRKFRRAGEAEVIFRALVETALKSQQEKRPTLRGRGRDTPEHGPDRQTAALRSVRVGTTVRRCLCVATTGGWAVLCGSLALDRCSGRASGTPASLDSRPRSFVGLCSGRGLSVASRLGCVQPLDDQLAGSHGVLDVLDERLAQQERDIASIRRHDRAFHVRDGDLAYLDLGNGHLLGCDLVSIGDFELDRGIIGAWLQADLGGDLGRDRGNTGPRVEDHPEWS